MVARIKRKETITKTRKRQILKAALTVFSTRGYGESTMADIAREAGIGVGTIYNYYKNKYDLFISLIYKILISEDLLKLLDGINVHPDSQRFINSLLEERLKVGFENSHIILLLLFEVQRNARLRRQYVHKVLSPLLIKIEEYIKLQIHRDTFREVNEKVIARTMAGAIIGSMILYKLEQRYSPFKKSGIPDLVNEMGNFFLNGLVRR
jgi:AcrR family transcriptional regulator